MKLKNLNTFSLFPLYMIPKIVVVGVLIVLLGIFASLISQVFSSFLSFLGMLIFSCCLRDKFIVAAGDSILRGPLLRMLSPFLSLEEMKYWPSHSFGAIKGNGLLVNWDYLAKVSCGPMRNGTRNCPRMFFVTLLTIISTLLFGKIRRRFFSLAELPPN